MFKPMYACIELDPEEVAKTNQLIFSEISSNQTININSNEVKNRHVQFGDPTYLGKACNSKCTFVASP